ncbi:hypothetical protein [Streptomyces sp. NPDC048277]|uniref:hypothetical protein n=1 Tax=Streptomyces sp. NPDC048277 TaxID=3155027 RepID=UPI0033CCBC57
MDQQTGVSLSEDRIRALYRRPADGSPPLVPHGMLPARFRKGAEGWENSARQRMHDLLKPRYLASAAEVKVLREAGIPLRARPKGDGFNINPAVPWQSEEAAASARVASATGIARLYGLAPNSSPLVPLGMLPAAARKGAEEWEKEARQRTLHLLEPENRVSAAEERILKEAGIPLLARPKGGGFYIDPAVPRQSDESASSARAASATGIARLYGLAPNSSPLVPLGMLPAQSRTGAEDWENEARQRTHHLLQSKYLASAAEVKVLRKAGIPLLTRPKGDGFNIDPAVPRQSDESASSARAASATGIARLYGLAPNSSPLVPLGMLPSAARKGAEEWEKEARQRMHTLLKPRNLASAAEVKVLREAGIPLLARPKGDGFYIDPAVPRVSGLKKERGTVPVLQSGQPTAADALASAPPATTADTLSGWGPAWDTLTLMWQNTQDVTWPDLATANPPMPSQDDRPTPILTGAGQYLPPTWTTSRQPASIPRPTTRTPSPPHRPTKQQKR